MPNRAAKNDSENVMEYLDFNMQAAHPLTPTPGGTCYK
jgi:hypothetical protein